MSDSEKIPSQLMQRVQIQAQVILPILKRLRAEIGEERANAIVYDTLRTSVREWVEDLAPSGVSDPIELWRQVSHLLAEMYHGDVAYEISRDDKAALELDVMSCRYADYFRSIGEPELGTILTCELDDRIADLAGPSVEFSRPETLMRGGHACPFRYRLNPSVKRA